MFVIVGQDRGCESISVELKKLGSTTAVVTFAEPSSALAWVKMHHCDLVIIDTPLSTMSVNHFIRWCHRFPRREALPVLVLVDESDYRLHKASLPSSIQVMLKSSLAEGFREYCALVNTQRKAALTNSYEHLLERNPWVWAHCQRVARYSTIVAQAMGLADEYCRNLEYAACLHDIGKLGIPDYITTKASTLTPEERKIMMAHTTIGYEYLCGGDSPGVAMAATVALYHHEHFNGGGYPFGRVGEEIPLAARIVAVVDVYDALKSDRPYKLAWSLSDTIAYIKFNSGRLFDPDCVNAFFSALDVIVETESEQLLPTKTV